MAIDNTELIEQYDGKLAELLTRMHNDGLTLPSIILLLDQKLGNLRMIESTSADLAYMTAERLKKALESPSMID